MKLINLRSRKEPQELFSAICDNAFVSDGIRFNDKGTRPYMHVKDKGNGKFKIKCEIMGGPTKDNGFLEGTYFIGKIKKTENGSAVKGIILTAPIFHFVLFLLTAFIIAQCIFLKAINVVPVFAVIFDIMLFRNEFKKQGQIQRYLMRAIARLEKMGRS